ncbi:MAG: L-threonylcarbamoyladenylate synthase [Ignavibacteria bacterium]|nr:MAG: L-threonylcarbamoyladenylate synthase [Ignavibacteria bacterium]
MSITAKLINIDVDFHAAVNQAAKLFHSGDVFIYPTDTVYGFGCNPFDRSALNKINLIKARREKKRYIILIDSVEALYKYVKPVSDRYANLLIKLWPNPVSVILNLNQKTGEKLNYKNAAFRIPANNFCITLLNKLDMPLISTSVNLSNEKQLNDYLTIKSNFQDRVSAIFYTKSKSNTNPSTIIDLTKSEPVVIREGKINFMELYKKFT